MDKNAEKFIYRIKPEKPTNELQTKYISIYEFKTLGNLVREVQSKNLDMDSLVFADDLEYKTLRTTVMKFAVEMAEYNVRLKAYNKWVKDNYDEVKKIKRQKERAVLDQLNSEKQNLIDGLVSIESEIQEKLDKVSRDTDS